MVFFQRQKIFSHLVFWGGVVSFIFFSGQFSFF